MARAVFDTTILVSAFLKPVAGGASFDLLSKASEGAFDLYLSDDILEEAARVLLTRKRIRARYAYPDTAVTDYIRNLARMGIVVSDVPEVKLVRDPADDMIMGCAIAAKAEYLVTRDDDLLSLDRHGGCEILTPEAFLHVLKT
jgi:putative PIN family toxin of toxin-antitoxin system